MKAKSTNKRLDKIFDSKIENRSDSCAPVSLLGDLLAIVPRQLTCGKAFSITQRGYELTGFVLRHPDTGEMCIVEQSAVRWIGKDEAWNLMRQTID